MANIYTSPRLFDHGTVRTKTLGLTAGVTAESGVNKHANVNDMSTANSLDASAQIGGTDTTSGG